jgi:hypothetical protein
MAKEAMAKVMKMERKKPESVIKDKGDAGPQEKITKEEAREMHFFAEQCARMEAQIELNSLRINELQRALQESAKKRAQFTQQVKAKYGLDDKDGVNLETCIITRVPKAEDPAKSDEAKKK